jgi:hypothetical protein
MKKILMMAASVLLIACGPKPNSEDDLTLNSKFNSTWNIHETFEHNDDGSITYHAIPWSGLSGNMTERNLPVDWSQYESLTVEFAEPTKVGTQIMISHQLTVYGKVGIKSLVCYFDGQDVTSIDEVGIQAADSCTLVIKRVYLTPGTSNWNATPIWEGECVFGNWQNGIAIEPDKFEDVKAGDQLEFIYQVDKNDPNIIFWLFKTVYKDTDKTLEGNDYQLNEWGCSPVGEGGVFRIHLTENDAKGLKKHGLFANGHYNIVTQVNLLRRGDQETNPDPYSK